MIGIGGPQYSCREREHSCSRELTSNQTIVSKGNASTGEWRLYFGPTGPTSRALGIFFATYSLHNNATITGIKNNTWYHVAGVYNGTHVKVYLNGIQGGLNATTKFPLT